MHLRLSLVLLLLAGPAAGQQRPPSPSLADADRAFAGTLTNHDRAAFVSFFAPDAESTLPKATRGPEAIANAWLPFLIDPGTTMILTSDSVATTAEGDTGTSSGTFAIRGRTNQGVQTIPAGTYAITWRLLDGGWKIVTLTGSGNPPRKIADGGVGPFRFGMTRDEVSHVRDCQPYTPVAVTGGLECPGYRFDDRAMNISFLFGGDRLRRIQLWYYEGESSDEAREAIGRVVAYLQRTGSALIAGRPGVPATADGIIAALNGAPPPRGRQIVQLEINGEGDGSTVWFARIGRHEHGYLVMLFAQAMGG